MLFNKNLKNVDSAKAQQHPSHIFDSTPLHLFMAVATVLLLLQIAFFAHSDYSIHDEWVFLIALLSAPETIDAGALGLFRLVIVSTLTLGYINKKRTKTNNSNGSGNFLIMFVGGIPNVMNTPDKIGNLIFSTGFGGGFLIVYVVGAYYVWDYFGVGGESSNKEDSDSEDE